MRGLRETQEVGEILVSDIRKIALFAAAACLTVGLAATASAQQNGQAAPPAGGPPANAAPRGGGGGGGPFGALPKQDEAALKAQHPELYVLKPVSHSYKAPRTAWGDPDLRGMWPTDSFGGLFLERPVAMGDRVWLTDEEYKVTEARMEASREAPAKETKSGKLGMGNWVEETGASRRRCIWASRVFSSSSLRKTRSPMFNGRCRGRPPMESIGHMPRRSGSPQAVRAGL